MPFRSRQSNAVPLSPALLSVASPHPLQGSPCISSAPAKHVSQCIFEGGRHSAAHLWFLLSSFESLEGGMPPHCPFLIKKKKSSSEDMPIDLRERLRCERETLMGCLPCTLRLGTGIEPETQVCALTGNQNSNLLVFGTMLAPAEPPSQGQPTLFLLSSTLCISSSLELSRTFSNCLPNGQLLQPSLLLFQEPPPTLLLPDALRS